MMATKMSLENKHILGNGDYFVIIDYFFMQFKTNSFVKKIFI